MNESFIKKANGLFSESERFIFEKRNESET